MSKSTDPAHQTTAQRICPSSSEDEQEKQGQAENDFTPNTKIIPRRDSNGNGYQIGDGGSTADPFPCDVKKRDTNGNGAYVNQTRHLNKRLPSTSSEK
ncbi:hypothetical protein TNCV_2213911 [Trichonephila clavipes]|nr:hypothetical protein TNCV_2213911 [Trichonephila clavipes]